MFEQLKSFFVNHSLKLLALVCGFVVWFSVVSRQEARAEFDLPLVAVNLQDNMALVNPLPEYLPAELDGKAMDLIRLKLSHSARIEVDLSKIPQGYSRIGNERLSFISPSIPNVKMLRVTQSLLRVETDSRIEQKIPVHSRLKASAASGFTLVGEPYIIPDSIFISGARSVIAKIKNIQTKEFFITDLKWTNSFSVGLDLSSIPSVADIADTAVYARVKIEPLEHKVFSEIPVRLIGSYERDLYSLEPSTADVEVSGGKDLLSKVNRQDINLYIEFSRYAIENTDELGPTVRIMQPVASWQIIPDKFRLVKVLKEYDDEE